MATALSLNIKELRLNETTITHISQSLSQPGNTQQLPSEAAVVSEFSKYSVLNGRSGGQIQYGDTTASGNYTLSSTFHATKGMIIFGASVYNEANNRLGLGTPIPSGTLDVIDQTSGAGLYYRSYYNSDGGAIIRTYRARGTLNTPTQVISGDRLGGLYGSGWTSTNVWSGNNAGITLRAAEDFIGTACGTYLTLSTTTKGANTSSGGSIRMTIDDIGRIGVNTTTPLYTLDVNGDIGLNYKNIILNPSGGSIATDGTYGIYWHQGQGTPSLGYGIYRTPGAWTSNVYQQLKINFETGIQLGTTGIYDKGYVDIVSGKGLVVSSGNVCIGITASTRKLCSLDSTNPQLVLAQSGTAYCDFRVDSAHDLTITPTSSGGVTLKSTVDSTDFLKVQDANAASFIVADSVNQTLKIGDGIYYAELSAPAGYLNILSDLFAFKSQNNAVNVFSVRSSTNAYVLSADTSNLRVGINQTSPVSPLEVEGGTTIAVPVLTLDQNDIDEGFVDYQGISAANVANNITTWTAGAVPAGMIKNEINGTAQWMPYYSAPTGVSEIWTAVTFQNSWANYGGGFSGGGYTKNNNVVRLQGLITGGVKGTVAFTLPAGYRPPYWKLFCGFSNTVACRVDISSAGAVIVEGPYLNWVCLDGISFPI